MKPRKKAIVLAFVGATLAVVVARLVVWDGDHELALERDLVPAAPGEPRPEAAIERRSIGAERATEIEPPLAEAVQPEPAEPSVVSTIEVLVTDLDGLASGGVVVYAAPPRTPLNRVGETDAKGRRSLVWRPGPGAPELVVALRSKGKWLGGLRRFRVPVGATGTFHAALDPALLPEQKGSSERVEVYSAIDLDRRAYREFEMRSRARRAAFERFRPSARTPDAVLLERGELAFAFIDESKDEDEDESNAERRVRFGRFVSRNGARAHVSGVVRDLSGLPAAGVRVRAREVADPAAWMASSSRTSAIRTSRRRALRRGTERRETVTDLEGRYVLDITAGDVEIEVGAAPDAGVLETLSLGEGETRVWDAVVDRGLVLAGTVRKGPDTPVPGALVEATHATRGGLWLAIVVTDERGVFAVPRCPQLLVGVDVIAPDAAPPLPSDGEGALMAGGEPWVIDLAAQAPGVVTAIVRDENPDVPLAAELRIWDAEGTRGARRSIEGTAGERVTQDVAPGSWSLSVGALGEAWTSEIPFGVLPGETADLGDVTFAATGWLVLPEPASGSRWQLDRLLSGRPAARAFSTTKATEGQGAPLPPGGYRLMRVDGEGKVLEEREIELFAGRREEPFAQR